MFNFWHRLGYPQDLICYDENVGVWMKDFDWPDKCANATCQKEVDENAIRARTETGEKVTFCDNNCIDGYMVEPTRGRLPDVELAGGIGRNFKGILGSFMS